MRYSALRTALKITALGLTVFTSAVGSPAMAADQLVALYSSHAVPYSMPWVAEDLGLFKKYDLDFGFVYIPASSTATAAILGNNVEVGLLGGVGIVNAYANGATDLCFIGSIKNIMTQSILAKPNITKLDQLRGKRIGVTRIGSNTHFFTVQALRRAGMNPDKDITFIQTGGDNETLGALASGRVDAASMLPPTDGRAIALGFHYVVFGPDIAIPYAASTITTRRSVIAKRGQVIGRFMRAMAEASKSMHRDKDLVYRVLEKKLRITDRAILDASYAIEMKVMEPRLELKAAAIQPMIEEVAKTNPRANEMKAQDLMDRRYLAEMESSGFFNQVWNEKR
ncbi:MAG TPA: ABC transporter substrate-binding protein [Phototrophicaceae bacterium]|nr:ABC transporter substrate-binding protein [Phototrophicaceae bacterium]